MTNNSSASTKPFWATDSTNTFIGLGKSKIVAVIAALIGLIVVSGKGAFAIDTATLVIIFGLAASGLSVCVRYVHLLDGGHAIYFAGGAYVMIIIAQKYPHIPMIVALVCGAIVGYLLAFIFAMIIGGLPGLYFTLATMAGSLAMEAMLGSFALFGGESGISSSTRGLMSSSGQLSLSGVYWLSAIVFVIVIGCLALFGRSRYSKLAKASKAGSQIAKAVGFRDGRVRVQVMALSGLITGLAGGLYAMSVQFVDPGIANIQTSLSLLAIVVLAGNGLGIGPIIGAALIEGAPAYLPGGSTWGTVIVGAVLMIALSVRENRKYMVNGITWLVNAWSRSRMKKLLTATSYSRNATDVDYNRVVLDCESKDVGERELRNGIAAVRELRHSRPLREGHSCAAGVSLLKVESLTVAYDGVLAVNNVSLEVHAGQIHAIIGPNGAGKSSLLGAMSGMIAVTSGQIRYVDSSNIDHDSGQKQPAISRTFQTPHLVEQLDLRNNISIGCSAWAMPSFLGAFLPSSKGDSLLNTVTQETNSIMAALGLSKFGGLSPESAPIGILRMVEVARCIATRAKVVLLDEPAAGLSQFEKQTLLGILDTCRDLGLGIILVEHDMSLVAKVADRVTVMANGAVIAEGTPKEVWENSEVSDVYFDTDVMNDTT